jgi:phage tail-like protein
MAAFNLRLNLGDEDPLTAYNFLVFLKGTTLGFSEVSGLVVENGTVTYQHGLSFQEGELIQLYRHDKYIPVTMKKGIVRGATRFYRWFKSMDVRNMDVSLCDEDGIPAVTWHIGKALPIKISAPSLDASKEDEVAIDTFELMAAGISIEHHSILGL